MLEVSFTGMLKATRNVQKLLLMEKDMPVVMKKSVDEVVIRRIKDRLATDPRPPWKNHLFTKKLLQATRSEAGEDYVDFGYYIDYGMHIEPMPGTYRIDPHAVDTATLRRWVQLRYGFSGPRLEEVTQRMAYRIRTFGNKAYPIIYPTFTASQGRLIREFELDFASYLRKLSR